MNLLTEISKALLEVIKWPGMAWNLLCDFIGVPEWKILRLAIAVIFIITSIYIGKAFKK